MIGFFFSYVFFFLFLFRVSLVAGAANIDAFGWIGCFDAAADWNFEFGVSCNGLWPAGNNARLVQGGMSDLSHLRAIRSAPSSV